MSESNIFGVKLKAPKGSRVVVQSQPDVSSSTSMAKVVKICKPEGAEPVKFVNILLCMSYALTKHRLIDKDSEAKSVFMTFRKYPQTYRLVPRTLVSFETSEQSDKEIKELP